MAGMEVNALKCASITIKTDRRRKRWYLGQTSVLIDGEPCPAMKPAEIYKYLGVQLTGDLGTSEENLPTKLSQWLSRLTKSPLKPQQRMHALRVHVIPALYHVLSLGDTTKAKLEAMDRQILASVRKWLHMPKDCPNAYIWADVNSGGLGVPRVWTKVAVLKRERWNALGKGERDPVMEALLGSQLGTEKSERMSRNIRVDGSLLNANKKAITQHHREVLHSTVDGKGLRHFAESKRQSSWVTDRESTLSGKEYVQAVKVRGNLLATRARASRGRKLQSGLTSVRSLPPDKCPACPDRIANLAHMLQTCGRTHGLRSLRHNSLLGMLKKTLCRSGFICTVEPRIPKGSTFLKPDLVAYRDGGHQIDVLLVDPTIVSDQADFPAVLSQKSEKYDVEGVHAWLHENVPEKMKCSDPKPLAVTIEGLALSWRGCWAKESIQLLTNFKVSKRYQELMAVRTLTSAARIFDSQMKRTDA